MKRCAGLADRPCRKKDAPHGGSAAQPARRRTGDDRKQGYNQRYFQANRETLNEKRRERRRKARTRQAVVRRNLRVSDGLRRSAAPPCHG